MGVTEKSVTRGAIDGCDREVSRGVQLMGVTEECHGGVQLMGVTEKIDRGTNRLQYQRPLKPDYAYTLHLSPDYAYTLHLSPRLDSGILRWRISIRMGPIRPWPFLT